MNRRQFTLGSLATAGVGASQSLAVGPPELAGKMGIVTASLSAHIAKTPTEAKMTLLDFPQFMQDDLGLEIIDFNTANFQSFEPNYIEKLRARIDKTKCIATNMKLNQKVDMCSPDPEKRAAAMTAFKKSIDAAKTLGCRWARPLPRPEKPDPALQKAAFDELIDYAGERGITILVENFGWMMSDENSVVDLVKTLGEKRVGVGLDTGNWTTNEVRYPALEKTFPLAVTCDFKAKTLTKDFQHGAYELEKCFQIGWDSGFRGPWCFEHGNRNFSDAKRELIWLREQLEKWIAAAGK